MEEGKTFGVIDGVDLHSQLEDLLGAVRGAEENWRFDDRLDLAVRLQSRQKG
jgi:hypothetical protein